jgi:hypothetical protein
MVMKLDRGRSRFGPDLSLQLAFPFISPWTLDSQLMYLNTLGWNLQLSFFPFLFVLPTCPLFCLCLASTLCQPSCRQCVVVECSFLGSLIPSWTHSRDSTTLQHGGSRWCEEVHENEDADGWCCPPVNCGQVGGADLTKRIGGVAVSWHIFAKTPN